jgi:hypothetical protein
MKKINRDAKERISENAMVIYKYISSNIDDTKEAAKAIIALKDIIEITCGTEGLEIVVKKMGNTSL